MLNYLGLIAVLTGVMGCNPVGPIGGNGKPTSTSREISFTGANGLQLLGTLQIPSSRGPVPALLLIPGSGPTDRDGNSGGLQINILKQIADKLAEEGYATLRFDKRATARYQSTWPKTPEAINKFFAYRNFIGDAAAAFKTLQAESGVDPKRVGILGHSEGGLYALQIASDAKGTGHIPSELVLVSCAGRILSEVIRDQLAFRTAGPSVPRDLAKRLLDYSDRACAALAEGKPLPPDGPAELQGLYNATVMDLLTAYMRTDPCVLAKNYSGRVLIINGGDDTQVSPEKDAKKLYTAFKARQKGAANLVVIPKVSHNMKSTADGNRDQFEGPVVAPALKAIVSFLKS